MEIINRLRKIGNALDKAGNIFQADFVDKNMVVLAMLARNKMTKIRKEAGMAEDEIQRLFLALLPKTKWANRVHSVGGFERDKAMGIPSKDLDIVVDSPKGGGAKEFSWFIHRTFPMQTIQPWPQGGKPDDKKEKKTYPIFGITFKEDVTYRGEEYKTAGGDLDIADSQKEVFPDANSRQRETFPATLQEDNERRDFTVNMLMRNLTSGELIDLTGHSLQDIKEGVLRHKDWLSMEESFSQDPLRIMRLIRFKCKYGWSVPFYVLKAAWKFGHKLENISWERITGELKKIAEVGKMSEAIPFMRQIGVLPYVLPEIYAMIGVDHDKRTHEEGDVYKHTLQVLSNAPPTIEGQFSALLHDVGKPETQDFLKDKITKKDKITFYRHENVGAEMAEAVMRRLKFDNDTVKVVKSLVRSHMRVPNLFDAENTNVKSYRKFVRKVGEEMLDALLDLAQADALGTLPPRDYIPEFRKKLEEAMKIPIEDKPVLNGNEIGELLNIKSGPMIGKAMKFLKDLADEKAEEGIALDKEEAEQALLEKFKTQKADDPRGILSGPVGSTGIYFTHYADEATYFYGPFKDYEQAKNAGFLCLPEIDYIDNIMMSDWEKETIDYIRENDEEERAKEEGEVPRFFKSPFESQWKDNPLVKRESLQWSDIEKVLLENRGTGKYILDTLFNYKSQKADDINSEDLNDDDPGFDDFFEIKDSEIHGKGIFAKKDIEEDDYIGKALTRVSNTGDFDQDFRRTKLGRYVNHSLDSNVKLEKDDEDENILYLLAIKNIKKDDELTCNYRDLDEFIDTEFDQFISELEKGNFQFVNTYSDNPRKDDRNQQGRGPTPIYGV